MSELRKYSFYFIPYLTVCGCLYHIAYWSTFNINGLSFIELSELVKSFIFPVLTFIVTFGIGYLFSGFISDRLITLPYGGGKQTKIGRFLNNRIVLIILFLLWFSLIITLYKNGATERWFLWAIFVELVPTFILYDRGLFQEYFANNNIRYNFIQAFFLIPIFSFASGKYYSESIKRNQKYQYIISNSLNTNEHFKNDTIKYLGNTESNYFFTNMNNSTIFIIRSENVDTLRLKQFEKSQ